jgi:SAM-dependent methyltransferase
VQRYPFATGPDEGLNRRCVDELQTSLILRNPPAQAGGVQNSQVTLPAGWEERSRELLQVLGRSPAEISGALSDYGWKVSAIPVSAERILSIGCGEGDELAVIRAAFPKAELHAIDWECKVSPAGLAALNVTFETANFLDRLEIEQREYDAIFSNHVIEHLFDPDTTLRQLRNWLTPGGALVSALPMDADPDRPFVGDMFDLLARPKAISGLDLDRVDLGHPWKTNLADLRHTLTSAGYSSVELFQRAEHLSRMCAGDRAANQRRRQRGELYRGLVFGPFRALLKFVPGAPYSIRKLLFAIEGRCWFGTARLKNLLAPEVLIQAIKGAA